MEDFILKNSQVPNLIFAQNNWVFTQTITAEVSGDFSPHTSYYGFIHTIRY